MAGEFTKLLPFTWRGMHLPILKVGLSLAHDLVEHKYWGVNGGRVEATGVAPIRISAVIPIANSIYPAANEKWEAGALYPGALRKFIIEFSKRETGYVQHPEFGEVACKPERMSFELTGERQDSTEIQASWVETLDDELAHKLKLTDPALDLDQAASDLNASHANLKALIPELPEFKEDIESLGRKVTAVVDTVSILSYRSAGLVNRIIYQAHRLEVSIKRAASNQMGQITPLRPFSSIVKQHALTWPAIEALQKIKAGAFAMRRKLLAPNGLGIYVVPAQTTVAGLVAALPNVSVSDLIRLNPRLARGPVVPRSLFVRYPLPG